jgi:phosphate uptake regulator
MKRKVNRVGQSTLTVSLPSKWAREHGVNAGDEIDVAEEANCLTISKSLASQKKETTIEVKSKERFLRRFLVTPYVKGYEIIHVKYDDPAVHMLVREAMNRYLLGFEIVEHGKNHCVLKNIAEGIESEFDINQRRYLLQVKGIISNLIEAIERKDLEGVANVLVMDQTIDKLCLFIRRMLNTKGYSDDTKGKSLYYINNLVETVSDYCRYMAEKIKMTGRFPSKNVTEMLKLIEESFDLYYGLFYKFDRDKIVDFKGLNNRIKKRILESFDKKDSDAIFYHYLLSMAELEHNLSEELE